MARQDRVPNPPKRPQTPQRRSSPSPPRHPERTRRMPHLIPSAGPAALAVVLAIVVFGGGTGEDDERAALQDAGCTLQSYPALANKSDHSDVPTLTSKPKWNSNPPTSGPHYGQTAVWGFYERGE